MASSVESGCRERLSPRLPRLLAKPEDLGSILNGKRRGLPCDDLERLRRGKLRHLPSGRLPQAHPKRARGHHRPYRMVVEEAIEHARFQLGRIRRRISEVPGHAMESFRLRRFDSPNDVSGLVSHFEDDRRLAFQTLRCERIEPWKRYVLPLRRERLFLLAPRLFRRLEESFPKWYVKTAPNGGLGAAK